MTREDILAMPAGRELDALVAEKVMGECKHDYKVVGPNVWNHQCQNCGIMDSNFSQSTLYLVGTDKEYSTDISAAWEVVEKICKNDDVKFSVDRNYSIKSMWVAGFNYNRGSYAGHTAPTAEEAICKAALLAQLEGQSHDL